MRRPDPDGRRQARNGSLRDNAPNHRDASPMTAQTPKKKSGLTRLWAAAGYSLSGLATAARGEAAFRQELALAAIVIPIGLWLGETGTARALLVGSMLVVLVAELINSAIEKVVDRVSGEFHPLSRDAKDIGSAAVFLSLVNMVVVWALVLLA